MALVVFFLVFNVVLVAAHFRAAWKQRRDPGAGPAPRRMTARTLRSFGVRQLLLVAILATTHALGWWDSVSVGIMFPPELWELSVVSILVGEVGFVALSVVYVLLIKIAGRFETMVLAATRGNLLAWPRKRSQKLLAVLFIMILNPFTEELVMRGILIHQWGLHLGSPVIPIAVGFVLNAAMHWYQGWRMQLWHAMFFALAVTLLYQWDLVAAIAAHVLGDVAPFLAMRRNLRRARAERRRVRALRAAQPA
jgi:membrane protease YdiL (CAAX protease family)